MNKKLDDLIKKWDDKLSLAKEYHNCYIENKTQDSTLYNIITSDIEEFGEIISDLKHLKSELEEKEIK